MLLKNRNKRVFDEVSPVNKRFLFCGETAYAAAFARKKKEVLLVLLFPAFLGPPSVKEKDIGGKEAAASQKNREETNLAELPFTEEPLVVKIKKLKVDESRYSVKSIATDRIDKGDYQTHPILEDLRQHGVDLSCLAAEFPIGIKMKQVKLAEWYRRIPAECKGAGKISWTQDMEVRKYSVNKKLRLKTGDEDIRVTFEDSRGNGHLLYIMKFGYNDPRKSLGNIEVNLGNAVRERALPWQREDMIQQNEEIMLALQRRYPEGCRIPVIEYETAEDCFVNFRSISVEEKQQTTVLGTGAKSKTVVIGIGFIMEPEKRAGSHGGICRVCELACVDEEKEYMDVELYEIIAGGGKDTIVIA